MYHQKIDRYKVNVDIIMIFLVALATTVFGIGLTWNDQFSLQVGLMLVLGLTGALFVQTVGYDLSLDRKEWNWIIVWAVIDASVIAFYTLFVREGISFQTINNEILQKISSSGVGVAEECLFGLFLTPFFFRFTKGNLYVTLLAVMSIFMLYHIYVYGVDLQALMIVTGGRGILSLSVIMTRRVTSATLAHAGVNFLVA